MDYRWGNTGERHPIAGKRGDVCVHSHYYLQCHIVQGEEIIINSGIKFNLANSSFSLSLCLGGSRGAGGGIKFLVPTT